MKKIVALALTVVMVLGLLAGCGEKPMDVQTLAQKMDEVMKGVTAVAAQMGVEMDMTLGITGMSLTMGMDMDADMKYKMDMSAGYVKMKMGIDAMGQSEVMEVESYFTCEDGKHISYAYNADADAWVKSEEDAAEIQALQEQMMGVTMKFSEFPVENMTLAEEQETVDGKSCYVLTVNADGTYMQEVMGTMMESLTGGALMEQDTAMLEQMDWSALGVSMTYHVDAATFLPVQMHAQVQGMGEMMNSLIADVMAEQMLGEGMEGLEMTIDIPAVTVSMTGMAYNDIEVPAVPQDAIDHAVDADAIVEDDWISDDGDAEALNNPPQADGSYLLQVEDTPIHVSIPEGYDVMMSEMDFLEIMTTDYTVAVIYMAVPRYTHQEMMADYEVQVQMAKKENRWLSNEEAESINGFTVVNMIYSDGVYEVTAWKEVPGGLIAVSGSCFEYLPEMDAVLNQIVIGE